MTVSLLGDQDDQLHALIDSLSQPAFHSIGRSLTNSIVISDGRVSGQHARLIECTPTIFLLEDLDSKNGTFVDGTRISRKFVDRTNELRFADSVVTIDDLVAQLTKKVAQPVPPAVSLPVSAPPNQGSPRKEALDFREPFADLERVYTQYPQLKRSCKQREKMIRTGSVILSSVVGISAVVSSGGAALGLLQIMSGAGLSVLVPTLCSTFLSTDEKLELIDKEYRERYRCPNPACRDQFGTREWEALAQQKTCRRCQAVWAD